MPWQALTRRLTYSNNQEMNSSMSISPSLFRSAWANSLAQCSLVKSGSSVCMIAMNSSWETSPSPLRSHVWNTAMTASRMWTLAATPSPPSRRSAASAATRSSSLAALSEPKVSQTCFLSCNRTRRASSDGAQLWKSRMTASDTLVCWSFTAKLFKLVKWLKRASKSGTWCKSLQPSKLKAKLRRLGGRARASCRTLASLTWHLEKYSSSARRSCGRCCARASSPSSPTKLQPATTSLKLCSPAGKRWARAATPSLPAFWQKPIAKSSVRRPSGSAAAKRATPASVTLGHNIMFNWTTFILEWMASATSPRRSSVKTLQFGKFSLMSSRSVSAATMRLKSVSTSGFSTTAFGQLASAKTVRSRVFTRSYMACVIKGWASKSPSLPAMEFKIRFRSTSRDARERLTSMPRPAQPRSRGKWLSRLTLALAPLLGAVSSLRRSSCVRPSVMTRAS
mmetsp:Transcript_65978/g.202050  ORF Transcript_65978/g.202050 Transcript_65978/m.202050 type:complete len:452 (+) Transcript_65978:62-1417(+)